MCVYVCVCVCICVWASGPPGTEAANDAPGIIPEKVAADIIYYTRLTSRIQLRLVMILMDLPDLPKLPKQLGFPGNR